MIIRKKKLYTIKIIFLKYLKIWLDIDLRIILLDHQNNHVAIMMSNVAKSFEQQSF